MQKISTTEIPQSETNNMADAFLTAVKAFYENPVNVRKFEEWKKRKASTN